MRKILTLLLVVAAAPLPAQTEDFDIEPTAECLSAVSGAERQACVGRAADDCSAGAGSNVEIGNCVERERRWWDDRLNATYEDLMAAEENYMAEMAEIGASVPETSAPLREMQRAWARFRDASCDYEGAQWGGGSGTGIAMGECAMRMTALQTLRLEDWLAGK